VLQGIFLGVVATLNAAPCASETIEFICSGVAEAIELCNHGGGGDVCFCELAPSEVEVKFDEEMCIEELSDFLSIRRHIKGIKESLTLGSQGQGRT